MCTLGYGTADFTARTLSHGKYCCLRPTCSVAESVFITPLSKDLRDQRLDLDASAEALHRAQGNDVPNKTTQACAYLAPLVELVTHHLAAHAPAAAEGSAGGRVGFEEAWATAHVPVLAS